MGLTLEQIKAKKIAAKQKQIATKVSQIAKLQATLALKETLNTHYEALLEGDLRPKQLAIYTKSNQALIAQISKYNASIQRYDAQRIVYVQQLAVLVGTS